MIRPRPARLAVGGVMLATVAMLAAGCATTVAMQPAAEANDPACAAVTVRLPDSVDGQERHWTDAQATGAWGSPVSVLLTCGLEPLAPSTLPCETVGGVDWLIDDAEAPNYRFTTYGRVPAVEVYLDYDRVSARSVLDRVAPAVDMLPTTGSACTEQTAG